MALTKVSYSMITGAPINVLDYGADPTGVTDSTAEIQAAIAAGDSIYCPTGTYLISGQLNVGAKTLFGDGLGLTTFQTNVPVGSSEYAAITLGNLGWVGSSNVYVGGCLRDFSVDHLGASKQVIGILVTGVHNCTLLNVRSFGNQIGFYVENVSEMSMTQVSDFTSTWAFVFDNRLVRTAAQRPGGFGGNTSNDVSSCAINMLTSVYSQQNGILMMNCGTMNFMGMTMSTFSDNPSSDILDMPYGFPLSKYGIDFYPAGTGNLVRNTSIIGAVFEAQEEQGNSRICIRIYGLNEPITNITIDSCDVQTYTAYIQNNDATTFVQVEGTGAGTNVSIRNSGYIFNGSGVNTFFTGKLVNMVGTGNVVCQNIHPINSLATSTLTDGFDYLNMQVEFIYEMPIYEMAAGLGIPSGWTGQGAYATQIEKVDPGAQEAAYLAFNGGAGDAAMFRTMDFTKYMYNPKNIVIILIYTGASLYWDWTVNGQGDTRWSIKSDLNAARYGNTLYADIPNSNDVKIRFMSFPQFSAVTAFKTMSLTLGTISTNSADEAKLYYCGVGYILNIGDNSLA